jgi:hypothetical protein
LTAPVAAQAAPHVRAVSDTDFELVRMPRHPEHAVQMLDMVPDRVGSLAPASHAGGGPDSVTGEVCASQRLAWHGQSVPGGGKLPPGMSASAATIGRVDRIAFVSTVQFDPRNSGLFTADEQGVHPVAVGSGFPGAPGQPIGDPSPIGGTFGGIFGHEPAFNASGDLLFVSDVLGGSALRGLFLYRAGTQTIVKVAAVGDPSPAGGIIERVGPGSLNDRGVVVFAATGPALEDEQILRWENGVLSKVAAAGDPAPGGGTYKNVLGTFVGLLDGTKIPIGPIPDINNHGDVCFRAFTGSTVGLVVVSGGVAKWYVRNGDPTPFGGTFNQFIAANLNDQGMVAFLGSFSGTNGWFAGLPGSLRGVVRFGTGVDGGQVVALAGSRNPNSPLSNAGDVVVWARVRYPNSTEREWLLLGRASGVLETVVGEGDPSPLGGTIGNMNRWPSMNHVGQSGALLHDARRAGRDLRCQPAPDARRCPRSARRSRASPAACRPSPPAATRAPAARADLQRRQRSADELPARRRGRAVRLAERPAARRADRFGRDARRGVRRCVRDRRERVPRRNLVRTRRRVWPARPTIEAGGLPGSARGRRLRPDVGARHPCYGEFRLRRGALDDGSLGRPAAPGDSRESRQRLRRARERWRQP